MPHLIKESVKGCRPVVNGYTPQRFPNRSSCRYPLAEIDLEEAELTSGRERWQRGASSISAGVARAKE